jgi:hypothetical protein
LLKAQFIWQTVGNIFGIVSAVQTPLLELDWSAYADEVGRRVETVRRTQSVTQDELAAVTGLSRSQIQNIEASRSSPKKVKHPNSPAKRHSRTQAVEKSDGNATLHSIFLIAQALGVPPKLLIPDGTPDGDYRPKLDQTWSTIELDIILDVPNHPLPPTTRTSPLVKPPVTLATIKVPPVRITSADRAAIAKASRKTKKSGSAPDSELPQVEPEPVPKRQQTLKPPPPMPNSPTGVGSLLRTPPPKRRGMVRHDPI